MLPALIEKAAKYFRIDAENLKSAGKERLVVKARRVLGYIAVRKLGYPCRDVSKKADIMRQRQAKRLV
jgi:chromosomal replication initiation ATPase DnaA